MAIGLGAALLGSAAISAGGSLLGGLFGGKKPKVPELKPINFEQEQTNAIRQNIAALEPATKLAEKTTAAEQSLLETQLRRAIPGYDQIVQQASKNIGAAHPASFRPRFQLRFNARPLDALFLVDSGLALDSVVRLPHATWV